MNIDIGTRRQLFFDNHIIEMVQTMTRRMHLPVKHESNPLIRKDRPWEQDPSFRTGTMCVAHDPDEKLYKCWYCDYAWDYQTFMANTPKAKPAAAGARKALSEAFMVSGFQFETTDNRWLYAESEDGIEWRKPELDYLDVAGRKTNICLGGGRHGEVYVACFFRDELEQDPARRFKSLHWRQLSEQLSVTESQIRVAHSADGRSWAGGEEPITVGRIRERRLGDEMMVLPDVETGQYLLTVRETAMGDRLSFRDQPVHLAGSWNSPYYPDNPLLMNKRRVFVTNSNRLDEWPTLRELLVPDDRYDNLDEAFYSLPVIRAGEYYVGFLNVFHAVDNTMDVQLLYSRNAYDWTRVERGRTFLGLSPGSWDPYMVEVGASVIQGDDAIRIYYGGAACHHDWYLFGEREGLDMPDEPGVNKTALGLATLRPDGFCSLDSTVRPALFVTRPFTSPGSELIVNARCGPKGYLEVELSDAADRVVPGYERAACLPFHGDATRHAVRWTGRAALPRDVLGRGAKLRFFSRDCSLYSFAVEDPSAE